MRYIAVIEDCVGKKAIVNMLPMQPGDVPDTWADTEALVRDTGYQPATPIEEGVRNFVDWYVDFYSVRDKLRQSSG
jgi:UDP-glucuronate 4-epimerase